MLNYTIGSRHSQLSQYGFNADDENCEFIVHIGDIRDGQPYNSNSNDGARPCPESLYSDVITNIFKGAPWPTFIIPGDNGWTDCADADAAWGLWKQHLFPFNDLHWANSGFETVDDRSSARGNYIVERSSIPRGDGLGERTELFSIYIRDRGVLFFGMSLPGNGKQNGWEDSPPGRSELQESNRAWLEGQLEIYSTDPSYGVSGVVVAGHAIGTSTNSNAGFRNELERITKDYSDIPFLFVTDNYHYFHEPGVPFLNQDSNTWRIDADDTITPLIVEFQPSLFHTSRVMPVSFDRGCDCTTSHRPTRVLQSTDACYEYCEEVYNNCEMCSTKSSSNHPQCTGTYSESVNGVIDVEAGPPYNVCSGDGIGCSGSDYHASLSQTKAMVFSNNKLVETTLPDGAQVADTSRYTP